MEHGDDDGKGDTVKAKHTVPQQGMQAIERGRVVWLPRIWRKRVKGLLGVCGYKT